MKKILVIYCLFLFVLFVDSARAHQHNEVFLSDGDDLSSPVATIKKKVDDQEAGKKAPQDHHYHRVIFPMFMSYALEQTRELFDEDKENQDKIAALEKRIPKLATFVALLPLLKETVDQGFSKIVQNFFLNLSSYSSYKGVLEDKENKKKIKEATKEYLDISVYLWIKDNIYNFFNKKCTGERSSYKNLSPYVNLLVNPESPIPAINIQKKPVVYSPRKIDNVYQDDPLNVFEEKPNPLKKSPRNSYAILLRGLREQDPSLYIELMKGVFSKPINAFIDTLDKEIQSSILTSIHEKYEHFKDNWDLWFMDVVLGRPELALTPSFFQLLYDEKYEEGIKNIGQWLFDRIDSLASDTVKLFQCFLEVEKAHEGTMAEKYFLDGLVQKLQTSEAFQKYQKEKLEDDLKYYLDPTLQGLSETNLKKLRRSWEDSLGDWISQNILVNSKMITMILSLPSDPYFEPLKKLLDPELQGDDKKGEYIEWIQYMKEVNSKNDHNESDAESDFLD